MPGARSARPAVALLMLLFLAALPASSRAGTVSAESTMEDFVAPYPVTYRAAGGETNSLTVTTLAGNAPSVDVTVTDSTAPIGAGPGCRQPAADTVVCEGTSSEADFDLGDGDDSAQLRLGRYFSAAAKGGAGTDRLTVTQGVAGLLGGPGDDVLSAAGGAGRLSGGPGNDLVSGGRRGDSLFGGGGRDELHGGGGRNYVSDGDRDRAGTVDADVLDGGGQGCLDYSSRTRALRVDLGKPGPAGERGEGDRISGFTQVATGRGDDVLIGTRADERFNDGGGVDRVYARGGDDRIATFGHGFVVGGAGRDQVDYFYSGLCGRLVLGPRGFGSWLSRTCELLVLSGPDKCAITPRVRPQPTLSTTGQLLFRMRFVNPGLETPPCSLAPCHARLAISTGRRPFRPLAGTRFTIGTRARVVPIELPNARALGPVRLRARLTWRDYCEGLNSDGWQFDIGH